ncbi:MAG: DJ-1/PfpI family protein [Planctomycetota bacterium]
MKTNLCHLSIGCSILLALLSSVVHADDEAETKKAGKVLMPLGDATEAMDTLYPFFRLQEAGYEVVVAGPEARLYHMVLHEVPPNSDVPWDLTQEKPGYHIKAQVAFRDVNPEEYAGLFLSGGRAPEYIRYDKDLMRITRHFVTAEKPIAVVCHGIEIMAAAGGLKGGRRATTVGKCELDITQAGGTYVNQPCVVDGNLVSASTWHDYGTRFFKIFIDKMRQTSSQ